MLVSFDVQGIDCNSEACAVLGRSGAVFSMWFVILAREATD